VNSAVCVKLIAPHWEAESGFDGSGPDTVERLSWGRLPDLDGFYRAASIGLQFFHEVSHDPVIS
jgi:hypothetical protein